MQYLPGSCSLCVGFMCPALRVEASIFSHLLAAYKTFSDGFVSTGTSVGKEGSVTQWARMKMDHLHQWIIGRS